MMELTGWLDHVTDPSDVFTITDLGNGTFRIKKAGTVMTQGTPQDQDHFNNMEYGIWDAQMTAALLLNFCRQLLWRTEADEETAAARHDATDQRMTQHEEASERSFLDLSIAYSLLLNHARQVGWLAADLEKWAACFEAGEVEFTSTAVFPYTLFSRPSKTIALTQRRPNSDYVVLTEVESFVGNVGEIVVYDKLDNGFKLSYTGSASSVKIKYTVIGGPYT